MAALPTPLSGLALTSLTSNHEISQPCTHDANITTSNGCRMSSSFLALPKPHQGQHLQGHNNTINLDYTTWLEQRIACRNIECCSYDKCTTIRQCRTAIMIGQYATRPICNLASLGTATARVLYSYGCQCCSCWDTLEAKPPAAPVGIGCALCAI